MVFVLQIVATLAEKMSERISSELQDIGKKVQFPSCCQLTHMYIDV